MRLKLKMTNRWTQTNERESVKGTSLRPIQTSPVFCWIKLNREHKTASDYRFINLIIILLIESNCAQSPLPSLCTAPQALDFFITIFAYFSFCKINEVRDWINCGKIALFACYLPCSVDLFVCAPSAKQKTLGRVVFTWSSSQTNNCPTQPSIHLSVYLSIPRTTTILP